VPPALKPDAEGADSETDGGGEWLRDRARHPCTFAESVTIARIAAHGIVDATSAES